MAAAMSENYQLKWHSFGTHLHSCVASFLTNGDNFADVILHTIDGHQLLAHRFILSACSQYLHQILKTQTKIPSTLPLLVILPPEINYKTLKILIQYMYSGEATVSKDILENVLRGGDLLKIKGLWRPREEETSEKKLIKVQTPEQASSKTSHKQHSESKKNTKDQTESKDVQSNTLLPAAVQKQSTKSDNDDKTKKTSEKRDKLLSESEGDSQSTGKSDRHSSSGDENISPEDNFLQFLVIKEEPIEWNDVNEGNMELVDSAEMFKAGIDIKPEVLLEEQSNEQNEELYSPLTCELCSETFKLPADWVRHIQTHTDMLPAKRQRRGGGYIEEENGTFPPLHCDMCSKYFPTPAEWVHHIQDAHTEFELHLSNKSTPRKPIQKQQLPPNQHKICTTCNKKFPSHASMLIHKRTHTGEKPYMCQYCCKGFNVKSNLLRHLRTLHDKLINSAEVPGNRDDSN